MPTTQALQHPPLKSAFSPELTGKGGTLSGMSPVWEKYFNQLDQSIQSQLAAIGSLGITSVTQATLPNNLTSANAGQLFGVTDYGHLLEWNGSAFQWAPGENGSGYVMPFLSAPAGVGWHVCDGSTVNMLHQDGTISSVILPNYSTPSYLKMANAALAGPNPASGSSDAITAGIPSGTNSVPTFTGNAVATGFENVDTVVQSGTGVTVAGQNHTHAVTAIGTVSAPTFTGAALPTHSHGPGTIDLQNTQLLAYFRQ